MDNLKQYIKHTRGCLNYGIDDIDNCNKYNLSNKLNVYDWLENIENPKHSINIVELRFKNTRKEFYQNDIGINLNIGDLIAVEASPGHDIGIVSLTGELIYKQLNKLNIPIDSDFPKIYRRAKAIDIDKWKKAIEIETKFLSKSKDIVADLNINMKIGDIELQGDGTKAIFYYTAEERVDFRELIKIFADVFKIRIEMKQIGARQESGLIGGLGTCGRKLCCISWKTNFTSVTTNSARYQELSLNPTKLAGQCGKLKCCLNYEIDAYIEARKQFPDTKIVLKTKTGKCYFQKSDVFKKILWYSTAEQSSFNMVPVPIERVQTVIEMNKKGKKPESLLQDERNINDIINKKHNINISPATAKPSSKNKIKKTTIKNSNKKNSNKKNSNKKIIIPKVKKEKLK